MKTYGEIRVHFHILLNWTLNVSCQIHASAMLTPQRQQPPPPLRSPPVSVLQKVGCTPSWKWNSDRPSRYQPLTWLNESLNNLACPQTLNMASTALPVYCLLLKKIQLAFKASAESLNTRDDGSRKTYRSCQKHLFTSLYDAVILFITIISEIYAHL